MKWLLLLTLASLIYATWALLSLGAGMAASVILIFIELGLALSFWLRIAELRTKHIVNSDEIITGSPPLIWYLRKFEGYEVTDLRWERKIFGGFWIQRRLVHARDFPRAPRRSIGVSRTK